MQSVQHFPFPSPPAASTLRNAVRNLRRLGSLSTSNFSKKADEQALAVLNKTGTNTAAVADSEAAVVEDTQSIENRVDEGRLTAIGLAAAQYVVLCGRWGGG